MKNHEESPALYLDCDGVILADKPYESEVESRGFYSWSQYIVRNLAEVAAKRIWLTTWGQYEIEELEQRFGLTEPLAEYELHRSSQVDHEYSEQHSIGWKLDLIINDQKDNPRPFVWIDDLIDEKIEIGVNKAFDSKHPRLLIAPERRHGLQPNHLKKVQTFFDNIR